MKHFLLTIISLLFIGNLTSQTGIQLNTPDALAALTLYQNWDDTYLVDNCGNLVNEWRNLDDTDNHPKLLPNGRILYIEDNAIYERDWDNNIVRTTYHDASNLVLEYEIIYLPNGNYLCLGRRIEPLLFFEERGYNLSLSDYEWDDTVVEIVPETGEIVWEWRISDHIIQERDTTKMNYGVVADNPNLLDLDAISDFDWDHEESFMINGMDYNPELDQIALSVRKISEVVIIDHSTTLEESSTSEGGLYGMGGDPLYRWGNPQNYGQGDQTDRVLYYQHNPNWIEYGPYKGALIIYNNGLNRPGTSFFDRYSNVEIVTTDINSEGSYNKIDDAPYGPMSSTLTLSGIESELDFYSGYTSGAKVLPNGNIYITVGVSLDFMEVDLQGNKKWHYQADRESYIFRSEKYSIDYPGFEDKDLTAFGTVEVPSSNYDCSYFGVSTADLEFTSSSIKLTQHPDELRLVSVDETFAYELLNTNGQKISSSNILSQSHKINTHDLTSGMYLILIKKKDSYETIKALIN